MLVSRYVGDMLAWLHQATASEKEHLDALLKQVTVRGTTISTVHPPPPVVLELRGPHPYLLLTDLSEFTVAVSRLG